MNNRILVTYATRAGSTAEVAAAIAETLAARGYAVDVKPVKEKPHGNRLHPPDGHGGRAGWDGNMPTPA